MDFLDIDDSDRTDDSLHFPRTREAVGFLLHTTGGRESLASYIGVGNIVAGASSVDCLIDADGTRHHLMPYGRYPHHAGFGTLLWRGERYDDKAVSQLLYGISLDCPTYGEPTPEQYLSLATMMNVEAQRLGFMSGYPVYGHYATARPVGRCNDPCNFDWHRLGVLLIPSRAPKLDFHRREV